MNTTLQLLLTLSLFFVPINVHATSMDGDEAFCELFLEEADLTAEDMSCTAKGNLLINGQPVSAFAPENKFVMWAIRGVKKGAKACKNFFCKKKPKPGKTKVIRKVCSKPKNWTRPTPCKITDASLDCAYQITQYTKAMATLASDKRGCFAYQLAREIVSMTTLTHEMRACRECAGKAKGNPYKQGDRDPLTKTLTSGDDF